MVHIDLQTNLTDYFQINLVKIIDYNFYLFWFIIKVKRIESSI